MNESGLARRRGLVFATDALKPLIELSSSAEAHGFDRVWTTEYVGRDAIARALAISLRTTRIEVGTGVAYAFTRLPLAMAALAADVQHLSNGRFALGLSPGTRGVRRWYGAEFEHPAPGMAAYADSLRDIWNGWPAAPVPRPPLYAAAFNPIMTRYASAAYDGLVLHPLAAGSVHLHERLLPAVRLGSEARSTPLRLAAWRVTSIDDDDDLARRRAKSQLAFYFSTPSYAVAVEGTEWMHVPPIIREAHNASNGDPDWMAIGALIPEEMVDEFTLAGTPAAVRKRLAALERTLGAAGVEEVVFQTTGAGVSEDEVVQNCRLIIETLGRG